MSETSPRYDLSMRFALNNYVHLSVQKLRENLLANEPYKVDPWVRGLIAALRLLIAAKED